MCTHFLLINVHEMTNVDCCSFPVAGSLTPLISLFLVDIVQLVSDKEVNNTFNRRRKRSNAGYDEDDVENKYKTYYKGFISIFILFVCLFKINFSS